MPEGDTKLAVFIKMTGPGDYAVETAKIGDLHSKTAPKKFLGERVRDLIVDRLEFLARFDCVAREGERYVVELEPSATGEVVSYIDWLTPKTA